MTNSLTKLRWALFAPVGYLAGAIAWGITLGFFSGLGNDPNQAAFICTVAAALFPVVGYRIGRWIAPDNRPAVSWWLVAVLGFEVLFGAACVVWLAATGEPCEISSELLPSLSPQMATLLEGFGLMAGSLWAYHHRSPSWATKPRPEPVVVSSFDWSDGSCEEGGNPHEVAAKLDCSARFEPKAPALRGLVPDDDRPRRF